MLRNFFIANLFLLLISGYLCVKIYSAITSPIILPEKVTLKKSQTQVDSGHKDSNIITRSYDILVKKNPFNPERRSQTRISTSDTQIPTTSERPKLFGTILMGDVRKAILEDPVTKERKIYGINDFVGGYVITDIQKEKVLLSRDGQEIEIRLREDKGLKPLKIKIPSTRKTGIQKQRRPYRPTPRLRKPQPQTPPTPG